MSAVTVEIDPGSGFCGGVIAAISKAEAFLKDNPGATLYSLGDIVHNEEELSRLGKKGMVSVNADQMSLLPAASPLLIRAHGEPPSTYSSAEDLGLNLIDCTCPVVLKLQKDIRSAWSRLRPVNGTVVIFGKTGHAEVLGLLGQTDGHAVVIEDEDMLLDAIRKGGIDCAAPVEIFSQTTKSPEEYARVCAALRGRMSAGTAFTVHDTICRQVASRHSALAGFAASHDVIVFVSGDQSSNGKVLFELCASVNPRTFRVTSPAGVDRSWFDGAASVGISGATSTPGWLLDDVASRVLELCDGK